MLNKLIEKTELAISVLDSIIATGPAEHAATPDLLLYRAAPATKALLEFDLEMFKDLAERNVPDSEYIIENMLDAAQQAGDIALINVFAGEEEDA